MRAELLNSAGRLRLIRTPHRVNSTTINSITTVHTRSARHLEAQILAIKSHFTFSLSNSHFPPTGHHQLVSFRPISKSSASHLHLHLKVNSQWRPRMLPPQSLRVQLMLSHCSYEDMINEASMALEHEIGSRRQAVNK